MLAFDYESSEAHVRALTTILFLGPHYSPKSLVNSTVSGSRHDICWRRSLSFNEGYILTYKSFPNRYRVHDNQEYPEA